MKISGPGYRPNTLKSLLCQNPGALGARVLALGVFIMGGCEAFAQIGSLQAIATPMNSVYLRWVDLTPNETGFLIERKSGEGFFAELVTTPPDNSVYTDTGLQPSTVYTYRIQALSDPLLTGSQVVVETLPAWSVPQADMKLNLVSGEVVELEFPGQGAFYFVEESTDLKTWSAVETGTFLGRFDSLFLSRSIGQIGKFFRVGSQVRERPTDIGLSMPFEIPPVPTGDVWDVTLFGSSPANINSTNDDAVGILTAISIAAPGDVILIPAGTYTIRQTLTLPSGLTLRGAGMDETLLITEGISRAVVVPPLASDIRIEQFGITYLGDTEAFEFGVYVGSSRTGANSHRILIDSLRIERFSVHGVSLRDCHHVLVQNCEMLNATNLGAGGHGYGIALNYPTNHNNWIRNNTIGPVIRHAILLQYYSHNNLVEHNLAEANSEDAYDLHGEDEYANELRFNTARNGERDGFGVGNTGATHDRAGPHNWIHHNTVENSLYGIEVIQDSDVVYIDHNTFSNNSYGVRVHNLGGNHVYVRGNLIQGNNIGISLESTRWVWLLDNVIKDQTAVGINIGSQVEDLVEEGNVFSGNAKDINP